MWQQICMAGLRCGTGGCQGVERGETFCPPGALSDSGFACYIPARISKTPFSIDPLNNNVVSCRDSHARCVTPLVNSIQSFKIPHSTMSASHRTASPWQEASPGQILMVLSQVLAAVPCAEYPCCALRAPFSFTANGRRSAITKPEASCRARRESQKLQTCNLHSEKPPVYSMS